MRSILRRIIPALAASFLLSQPLVAAEELPTNLDQASSATSSDTVTPEDRQALDALVEKSLKEPEAEAPKIEVPSTFSPNRDEASCIALAVFHEARGESLRGQQAVAHAILNRVKSPKYPKTACGVVYQKGQFSFFSKGPAGLVPRKKDMGLWQNAMRIAMEALYGQPDPINGAISFYNPKIGKPGKWAYTAAYSVRIGGHVFFRPR